MEPPEYFSDETKYYWGVIIAKFKLGETYFPILKDIFENYNQLLELRERMRVRYIQRRRDSSVNTPHVRS